MKTIGERIKEYRIKIEMSQKDFAEAISKIDNRERSKWGQSRIGNYETNTRMPDLEDIKVIAKVLNMNPADLAFSDVESEVVVQGVEVRGSLLFDLKGQVGTFTPADKKQFIDFRSNDPDAYAIQIRGQGLMPRVKNTEYLVIEPCKTIQLYDDVLIRLKEENEFLVKTFVAKPDDKYDLYAFNDINTGLASNDSESYNKENIVIMEYVAAIVSKHRLMK